MKRALCRGPNTAVRHSSTQSLVLEQGQVSRSPRVIEYDYMEHLETRSRPSHSRLMSARRQRLHPHTIHGKSTGPSMLVMPESLSSVVSEATKLHRPQDLRQNAAKYFVRLGSDRVDSSLNSEHVTSAHVATVDKVDVDTHLTAVFLQAYASLYNVLKETRARMGESWRPDRVLDVGYGPATGILALNEVMAGSDWSPSRKRAVIIGNPLMKTRAQAMLKLQEMDVDAERESGIANMDSLETHAAPESGLSQSSETATPVSEKSEKSENATKANVTSIHQSLPAFGSAKYDLIIATHQLYNTDASFPESVDKHTVHLLSLLHDNGVLVLVERGDPNGFESVARARQIVLRPEDHAGDVAKVARLWKGPSLRAPDSHHLESPSHFKVIAPCSHHGACPLQVGLEMRTKPRSRGFFNWCKFGQVVQRPRFMLELKKGKFLASEWLDESPGQGAGGKALAGSGRPFGRSYETATHSYIVLQKVPETAERVDSSVVGQEHVTHSDSWARVMRNPMKRDKHVIFEVCSPSAEIEQWTVTRSFSRQAYHDARKAAGGDLWALGAKTVQARGGSRKQMAKVERAKQRGTDQKVETKPAVATADPWEKRNRKQSVRGYDPDPEESVEDFSERIADYFERSGQQSTKEFVREHQQRRRDYGR